MSDLSSALIGALAAVTIGFGLEHYKRHRERQSLSAAISGEINALIKNERRTDLLGKLRLIEEGVRLRNAPAKGMDGSIPTTNPVFDKVADKIGNLPEDLSGRVSEFYVRLLSFRIGLTNLLSGVYDRPPFEQPARLISVQLLISELEEGMAFARDLVKDMDDARRRPPFARS